MRVSRVNCFSVDQDTKLLRGFLFSQVGEEIVTGCDIHPATRHGWELGRAALAETGKTSPTGVPKEVYWTLYPELEDERSRGIFICSSSEKENCCAGHSLRT